MTYYFAEWTTFPDRLQTLSYLCFIAFVEVVLVDLTNVMVVAYEGGAELGYAVSSRRALSPQALRVSHISHVPLLRSIVEQVKDT